MNKLLLFLSCTIAVMADMLFVWWAKKPTHPLWSLITAILMTLITICLWGYTMRKGIESATAITVYALFTVAGCTALGYFVFNENLSIINWIGIAIAIIALILIGL